MRHKDVNFDYVFIDLDGVLQNNHSKTMDPVHVKVRNILRHIPSEKLGVITNNPVAWGQLKTYGFDKCVNPNLVFQSYFLAEELARELIERNDFIFLKGLDEASKKVYQSSPEIYASLLEDVVTKKPSPYMFNKAVEGTGADPSHCLIIGDSFEDILGGNLFGFKTLYLKGLEDDRYLTVDKLKITPDYIVERDKLGDLETVLFGAK